MDYRTIKRRDRRPCTKVYGYNPAIINLWIYSNFRSALIRR